MAAPKWSGEPIIAVTELGNGECKVYTTHSTYLIDIAHVAQAVVDQDEAEQFVLKDIYDRIGELTDAVNVLSLAVERLIK